MEKILKIIMFVVVTIVLGAIGSGLWERVLAPLFDNLVQYTNYLMNMCSNIYKDSVYREVGNGFREYSSVTMHTLILMVMPMSYWFATLQIRKLLRSESDDKLSSKFASFLVSKKGYYSLLLLTISLSIAIFISIAKIIYVNEVITYSFRSLNIVAPYLPDQEIENLKSRFYSIQSASDFYAFNERLLAVANKDHVHLPHIKLL